MYLGKKNISGKTEDANNSFCFEAIIIQFLYCN